MLKSKWPIPEWLKILLAGFLALLVLTLSVGTYLWFFNPNFRLWFRETESLSFWNQKEQQKRREKEIQELSQRIVSLNSQNRIYQTIRISDLPIYPEAWRERHFNSEELRNSLISGPEADPDNDGLSNKEEYFFGSHPKNADTLCSGKRGKQEGGIDCQGLNDKQNIEKGISPLTGLPLEEPPEITILSQDLGILESLKESFEIASREQIDFPTLYQLSRTIDLEQEFKSIKVLELTDNTQNILDYQRNRLQVLENFASDESLRTLIEIYQITRPEQFNQIRSNYQAKLENLQKMGVPKTYANSHRAYVLIFQKIVELIDLRRASLSEENLSETTFKEQVQSKAVELVWAYRKLAAERKVLTN